MNVVDRREKETSFGLLDIGDTFLYQDLLYIKKVVDVGCGNAFNLTNNKATNFRSNAIVKPVEVEVTIVK